VTALERFSEIVASSEGVCISPPGQGDVSDLVARLCAAKKIVALTGAGVSAESGVPTFRDAQTGFWSKFRPEELATCDAFERQPQLVWDWYAWRRELVAKAEPNPAHLALVEIESVVPDFMLITQNVDGLHWRAGSRRLSELHGNIARTKCFDEDVPVATWPETGARPPRCPRCGGYLRPDVVWFNELVPRQALDSAFAAARTCDVFLSIGTSTLVQPAAALPFEASARGATVIEINPDPTPFSEHADFTLRGPAGAILPAIARVLAGSVQQAFEPTLTDPASRTVSE
jgi:NAD-dependent deacetylase